MINEFIELVRSWPISAQLTFVIIGSLFATLIVLATIGAVGDFMNQGLTSIIHGYPPQAKEEPMEETAEEDT